MEDEIITLLFEGKSIYEIQKELNIHSAPIVKIRVELSNIKSELVSEMYKSKGTISKADLLTKVVSEDYDVIYILLNLVKQARFDSYEQYLETFKDIM